MIVRNPTEVQISVTIKGTTYEIEPKGSIMGVPEEHAVEWRTSTHQFIVIEPEDVAEVVEKVKEIIEEEVKIEEPEVTEEPEEVDEVEEVKEKKTKSSKK